MVASHDAEADAGAAVVRCTTMVHAVCARTAAPAATTAICVAAATAVGAHDATTMHSSTAHTAQLAAARHTNDRGVAPAAATTGTATTVVAAATVLVWLHPHVCTHSHTLRFVKHEAGTYTYCFS